MQHDHLINQSALGKQTHYDALPSANLLFVIPRNLQRQTLSIGENLPFHGVDIWNIYEVSWLNLKGKPEVGIASIIIPCDSAYLIESKSLKLYFMAFNQFKVESSQKLAEIISAELSQCLWCDIQIDITPLHQLKPSILSHFSSKCIDDLDIETNIYEPHPDFLKIENQQIIEESLHSNLLRSNCMATGQPDWASIEISYCGKKINHEGLLKYIISSRNHHEFHEYCVERIFMDILNRCQPEELTVYARYTRRGGIDINPYRSTNKNVRPSLARLYRQ